MKINEKRLPACRTGLWAKKVKGGGVHLGGEKRGGGSPLAPPPKGERGVGSPLGPGKGDPPPFFRRAQGGRGVLGLRVWNTRTIDAFIERVLCVPAVSAPSRRNSYGILPLLCWFFVILLVFCKI